jgi:radical SAM protein with 4Fe4S-binding SPASM domain
VKIPSPELSSSLPVAFPEEARDLIQKIQDFGFELALWPRVHNYGDGRSFNKPAADLLCPVIEGKRKHILNITWDLNVIPCCFDFNATIRFGNLRESSLEEIFSGPQYLQFVIAHRSKATENYPVCENCEKNDCLV